MVKLTGKLQPRQALDASLKAQQFQATLATAGPRAALKVRLGHTWGLVGDVSGITALPSIFVPLAAPQTATLFGIRTKLESGTVGVQVKRNGSNVGSVITVTPTAVTTPLGVPLADGDELTLALSSPVGTPSNFSATLILEQSS